MINPPTLLSLHGDPDFGSPFWMLPVIELNRCFIIDGTVYDSDLEPYQNEDIQKLAVGLHGYEGFLHKDNWICDTDQIDFEFDINFKISIYDTFLDVNQTYDDRYWFHIQHKDGIIYSTNQDLKREGISILYKWYVRTKAEYEETINHFKMTGWKGALIIKPHQLYNNETFSYVIF